jgi:hypothetical protein
MRTFDVLAFLDEAKRLTALTIAAVAVAGAVLLLDRAGGPLSAVLGILAAAFATRLLQQASMRPEPLNLSDEGATATVPVTSPSGTSAPTLDLSAAEESPHPPAGDVDVDVDLPDTSPADEREDGHRHTRPMTTPASNNSFRTH